MNFYRFFKRALDVSGSIIGILICIPIFIFISLIIYISDKGPIFFKQLRVGCGGVEFEIYKFRSMVVGAEHIGGFSTADNDMRITRVGHWIRKWSIDELPQLINVLKGEMSLVGPRPDVPAQKILYTDQEWLIRTSVKPGITGLAQATLRSRATPEQRKAMDMQYVREKSFINDLKIIYMTIRQLNMKSGN